MSTASTILAILSLRIVLGVFCPFYPCFDPQTGVEFNERGWGCSKCHWIHKPQVAEQILEELKLLDISNPEELAAESERIKEIRNRVFRKNCAT